MKVAREGKGAPNSLRLAAGRAIRAIRRARGVEPTMEDLALEVARLETRLRKRREALRAAGGSASPIGEAFVALDYESAPLKIVASAQKRWNSVEKEPYTVAWLERSLDEDDVLYDIGANIGAYSLIGAAASPPSVRVYAFEPGYDNFAALCANVVLNELADRIVPLPVTLGSRTGLATFRYQRLGAGTAEHDSLAVKDWEAVYEQPVLSFRLDDLRRTFGLPAPTHVKLDVDGAELAVLQGAHDTLRTSTLRELLVETEPGDEGIERLLAGFGFEAIERHQTPAVVNVIFARR